MQTHLVLEIFVRLNFLVQKWSQAHFCHDTERLSIVVLSHCSRHEGKKSMCGNVHVRLVCRASLFCQIYVTKAHHFGLAKTINNRSVYLFSDGVVITKSLFNMARRILNNNLVIQ